MKAFLKTSAATCVLAMTAASAWSGEIWVTNEKDDTVSVIATETLEVIQTYETGERPRGITFSKDYTRLYICASDSDAVQVMDPNTGEILHDLPSGERRRCDHHRCQHRDPQGRGPD